VSPYFPPSTGGLQAVAEVLAHRVAEGRPVTVLTSRLPPVAADAIAPGNAEVRRLWAVNLAHTPVMPGLGWAIWRARPRLVHLHVSQVFVQDVVWLLSRPLRYAYIAHVHLDVQPSGRLGRLYSVYARRVLPRVLRGAARVVVLSADQRSVAHAAHVRPDRIAVIPNGIDVPAPDGPPRVLRRGAALRVLFVGRLSPQKNVPALLQALAVLGPSFTCALLGDGPERDGLEALTRDLGIADRVRLVGRVPAADVGDWYRWADCLVLVSHVEGMPMVLLEAMAAGLPVVVADRSGMRELVGAAGVAVEPVAADVARALRVLAAGGDRYTEMSRSARARALEFSWDASVRSFEALYASVLEEADVR
jgi:glycosyltransferase involved in cell wall biosynthesis